MAMISPASCQQEEISKDLVNRLDALQKAISSFLTSFNSYFNHKQEGDLNNAGKGPGERGSGPEIEVPSPHSTPSYPSRHQFKVCHAVHVLSSII